MANSKYERQAKRLWATNDKKWLALRAVVLSEEPFCRICISNGTVPPNLSSLVDHIDGHAETINDYRRENLQGCCMHCHGLKSIFEDGGFGGTREKSAPRGCDANGNPIDPGHHWNLASVDKSTK